MPDLYQSGMFRTVLIMTAGRVAGWCCSKVGNNFADRYDEKRITEAISFLYTVIDPSGGAVFGLEAADKRDRCKSLLDRLAVELVGGVPEFFEEYT